MIILQKHKNTTSSRLIVRLLALALICIVPLSSAAQNYANVVNGATVTISACDGTVNGIVDDGGISGTYSNYFDGTVVLTWESGNTLLLEGYYDLESGYDWVRLDDGTGQTQLTGSGYCNYSSSSGMLTITFHSDGSVTYNGFALTWTVSGNSSCTNSISNLSVSNIGTTSATLQWNATNPSGPFTVVCGSLTATVNTTSYTLTGLNASTQHTARVMASGETSICCRASVTFRTACDTVHMPWIESFEDIETDTMPPCWTALTNFDETNAQPRVVNNYASDGNQSLMLSCGNNNTGGHFGLVFGPRLDLGANGFVKFNIRASHDYTTIVIGTCNMDSSYASHYDFQPISYVTTYNSWQEYRTSSAQNIAPGRSLAFYMLQSDQGGTGRRVYIDAINIDECGIATMAISNVESNAMTVQWTTYGTPSVTLHLRSSGSTTDVQTIPSATSPITLTGLDPSTYYTVTLSTQCGTSVSTSAMTADSAITVSRWCLGPFSASDALNSLTLVNSTGSMGGEHVDFSSYGGNRPCYVISPEFNNLAGKQVAVRLDGYYANVSIGLMRSRNDTSTFTPLQSCFTSYFQTQYLYADIPDTSTATFVALRYSDLYIYVHRWEVGTCLIDSLRVVHRRGTSVVLGLESEGPNDTIQVEYGYSGFEQGTGTVRTFVGQCRITIDSLNTYSTYDFIVSRPCSGTVCGDTRLRASTNYIDFPMPFCEDFTNTIWEGYYGYGCWAVYSSYDNTPTVGEQPYFYGAGMALRMEAYGLDNNYNSSVVFPEIPLDSGSVLSFYATNLAPDGMLLLGSYFHKVSYGDVQYVIYDTIPLAGYGVRQHYIIPLPDNDTIFDGRIFIEYRHSNQYQNFSVYIDEIQITHATYTTASAVNVDSNNASVVVYPYTTADTVFIVSLRDEADALVRIDTIGASDTAHFSGLSRCQEYKIYVQPLLSVDTLVCPSYAGYFVTSCSGGTTSVYHCFGFTSELSYELPYGWTTDNSSAHTIDTGYLHLYGTANARLCMPPYGDVAGRTLSITASGHGSIVIGYTDTNFISFTPFDTITLAVGSESQNYARELPAMPSDTLRIGLLVETPGDTIMLDQIGITLCSNINITIDGNTAICTTDDPSPLYYLFVVDTAGNERMHMVNEQTFVVEDLMPGWSYDFSWQCAYDDATCRPHLTFRTDNHMKLPYCINFEDGTETTAANAWEFVSQSTGAHRSDYSNSVRYYCSYSSSYLLLPPLDSTVTVATLDGYFYPYNSNSQFEIGVLTNGSDTSSFVSLWSRADHPTDYPVVDLSGQAGRRVAIHHNGYYFRINHLFIHPYSPMTVRRPAAKKLELLSSHGGYYVRANDYYGFDSILYIDSTYYLLDLTSSYSNYVYLQQVDDSLGNVCREAMTEYRLSNINDLSWCWYSDTYFSHFINYNTCGTNYHKGLYATTLYGPRTSYQNQIIVLPEMNIDSVGKLNVKFSFASEQTDTQLVELGVMTDALDTTTFVPVDTVYYHRTDSNWADFQVNMGNYNGSGRWIAFRYNPPIVPSNSYYTYSYLTTICIDSCAATGATVKLDRWNTVVIDNASGEGGFYAVYNRQWYSDYTIVRIDTVPTTLTLPGDTKYEFVFRCDSAVGSTCRPVQEVTTLGTPLEVPSCIDFESVPIGDIPPSWTRHHYAIAVDNTYANSGVNSLSIPISETSYIATGDINTDTLNQVALSLWMLTTDANDRVEVGAMTNPTDLSSFHPVRTVSNRQSGVWQRHIVILSGAPDDAHYIALRARSINTTPGRSLYIDDLHMTPCAVSDLRLSEVASSELTIEWQQAGTPSITVEVEEDGAVVNTLHPTLSPLTIAPINPMSAYTIRFSSDCNETGTYCNTAYTDSVSIVAPSEGGDCINPADLYSPQATFFSGTYNNPYSNQGAIDYGLLNENSRHTVCYDTAYRDPRTGGLLRAVPEGFTSSLRLGNWSTNSYAPEAEGVIYSLTVDTSQFQLILLRYAAVLQDPMHAPEDQPRFRIEVLDSTFTPIDPICTSADFIADASLGWNSAPNSVLWKDWTAVGIDLSSYADQLVFIRLTTFDCNEGSHYGYAYFTLECMRKAMESTACGAIDSNTFTAPAGFNYRWYSSQSAATISTQQSITVATADVTFFCELSKIDNPACHFTISTYGGTRYPMASFDTSITMENCRFYVDFTNTSGVSADGVNPLPGEGCESAFWDFGNGQTATSYHASTVYTLPGTYTVMLASGIAGDACTDTAYMNITLTIPDGVIPMDSTYGTICSNQQYTFYGTPYNLPGLYSHSTVNPGLCDSLHLLFLTVNPTSSCDTVATACDTYTWRDTTFANTGWSAVAYQRTAVAATPNTYGCDSTVTLHLTLFASHSATLADTIVQNSLDYSVAGTSVSFADLTAASSQYATFDSTYSITTAEGCDSTLAFSLLVWLNSSSSHILTSCRNQLPVLFNGDSISTDSSAADRTYHTLTTHGADSTIFVHLDIIENPTVSFFDTVVENQLPHTFRTFTFTGPADTVLTITPTAGCDTLASYHLHVWPNQTVRLVQELCDDTLPYLWNGVSFNSTDSASVVFTDIHGADSTVWMIVRVWPTYELADTHIFCPSDRYIYEGIDYGGPTAFDTTLLSANLCDSLVHVVLMPRDPNYRLYPLYRLGDGPWMPADTLLLGCAPDTLHLRDTTPGAVAWQWLVTTGPDTVTSTTDEITVAYPSANYLLPTTNSYRLIVFSDGGCIDTLANPIYIFRTPEAEFDWNPPVPAIDNPEVQFANLSSPLDSLTYLWRIPRQAGSTDCDTTSEVHPFHHWGQEGENMEGEYDVVLLAYWLQYAADTAIHHTCVDSATHTVYITNDFLQFPNLVTPNGDGVNDIWKVVNLVEYGNYPTNELWIYNQWGAEVYHVRDIRSDADFWDPNATASPDGTYYFRFSARGIYGVVKRNGVIEVLRK